VPARGGGQRRSQPLVQHGRKGAQRASRGNLYRQSTLLHVPSPTAPSSCGTSEYHHSLKALAIREKKIHIVGSPELKIEGTPVYLDVEGLPDRDFYYLIGLRIGNGDSAVQHSLWADTVEDEEKIWRQFLAILDTVEKPVLIHYGSYETEFFRHATKRYGVSAQEILDGKEARHA
jgi:hypothetical protein